MGEVLPFKKKSLSEKYRGKTLCREGFHKWVIDKEKQFDVKTGRLVTVSHCARCGQSKTQLL
jgi:hypothetical protein